MPGVPCLGLYASERLPSVKWATRVDLYHQLCVGREFLEVNSACDIRIADAAEVACLSRYHFVRLFKMLFGHSPGAFLSSVRLRRAKELIRRTNLPIGEIAFMVGMQDASSLNKLFRASNSGRPSDFRRNGGHLFELGSKGPE